MKPFFIQFSKLCHVRCRICRKYVFHSLLVFIVFAIIWIFSLWIHYCKNHNIQCHWWGTFACFSIGGPKLCNEIGTYWYTKTLRKLKIRRFVWRVTKYGGFCFICIYIFTFKLLDVIMHDDKPIRFQIQQHMIYVIQHMVPISKQQRIGLCEHLEQKHG